jgi:hypothetical protein
MMRDVSKWAILVAIPLTMLVHLVAQSLAAETVESRKMKRQVAVMEQVLDQVLVDSPNFLVPGRDNTRGIYLPEFGALFTFEASLLQKDWDLTSFGHFNFEVDDQGDKVIIWQDKDKDGEMDEDAEAAEDAEEAEEHAKEAAEEARKSKERAKRLAKKLASQEDIYDRGKKEILDVLLEYGETLSGLGDEQSIGIVGFLKDSKYFTENKISRLVMKAKMRDLRAYTSGQLTEQAMIAKVVQEEY